MKVWFIRLLISLLSINLTVANATEQNQIHAAVSANFLGVFRALLPDIQQYCECAISITPGASGILATQFHKGAPFDVFFSADSTKTRWLFNENKAQSQPVAYTQGQLVLLDKHRKTLTLDDVAKPLPDSRGWKIALANSKTAPYGEAAEQTLKNLEVSLENIDVIRGNSVLQALQFFQTGNVDQALIARSMLNKISTNDISWIVIPTDLHTPLLQTAVVNRYGNTEVAHRIVAFFAQDTVQTQLQDWGYVPIDEVVNESI